MPTAVHIYPLSKLVHASAGSWERQLRDIEEGKLRAYHYYLPLREAIVVYGKSRGKKLDQAIAGLDAASRRVVAGRGANPVKDNRTAFDAFIRSFYPRIAEFGQSLLRDDSKIGCEFEGVRLTGLPHFSARDLKGNERYIYTHASKWSEDDLKAYLELLSIIVEARFGANAESIWCMDLRTGTDFKWKSSPRLRAKCASAARLYARIIDAMTSSE